MSVSNGRQISKSVHTHLIIGAVVSIFCVGGLGIWATNISLAGAIVSNGTFVVDSYIKKVQHPTGGVVSEIFARDGDIVAAGDILMQLDATQPRAQLAIITKRLDEMTARLARLEAERDDMEDIKFPSLLLARSNEPDVKSALHSERRLFEFRRKSREGRKAQLRERITQYKHENEGLKAQETAYKRGLSVLEREIANLRPLYEKGIVNSQRLNSLEAQAATFGGDYGEKIALQAQVAGRISETKLQILSIDLDLKTEVGQELREIQTQLGEFYERKISAEDQLKRIDLIAPQDGIVHQLAVHTVGGVVSPADIIMSIVPASEKLALEVNILPQDVDQLMLGQNAVLRLSAFNLRTSPELNGKIIHIAADLTSDERTGLSWYLVRISVSAEELDRLEGLTLMPGMPAEALIQTGERTALSYFIKPLTDQINRAFREE